jgi:hypothetical protein
MQSAGLFLVLHLAAFTSWYSLLFYGTCFVFAVQYTRPINPINSEKTLMFRGPSRPPSSGNYKAPTSFNWYGRSRLKMFLLLVAVGGSFKSYDLLYFKIWETIDGRFRFCTLSRSLIISSQRRYNAFLTFISRLHFVRNSSQHDDPPPGSLCSRKTVSYSQDDVPTRSSADFLSYTLGTGQVHRQLSKVKLRLCSSWEASIRPGKTSCKLKYPAAQSRHLAYTAIQLSRHRTLETTKQKYVRYMPRQLAGSAKTEAALSV